MYRPDYIKNTTSLMPSWVNMAQVSPFQKPALEDLRQLVPEGGASYINKKSCKEY